MICADVSCLSSFDLQLFHKTPCTFYSLVCASRSFPNFTRDLYLALGFKHYCIHSEDRIYNVMVL